MQISIVFFLSLKHILENFIVYKIFENSKSSSSTMRFSFQSLEIELNFENRQLAIIILEFRNLKISWKFLDRNFLRSESSDPKISQKPPALLKLQFSSPDFR